MADLVNSITNKIRTELDNVGNEQFAQSVRDNTGLLERFQVAMQNTGRASMDMAEQQAKSMRELYSKPENLGLPPESEYRAQSIRQTTQAINEETVAMREQAEAAATLEQFIRKVVAGTVEMSQADRQEYLARIQGMRATEEHTRIYQSLSNAKQGTMNNSRGLRMEFFALTIASFGLQSAFAEIESATGQKLPSSFNTASQALRTFSSIMGAGAFFGAPGLIIGGLAGGVLALSGIVQQVDPAIQDLSKSLDSLANKNEAIDTLARITGTTHDLAAAMMDAARKSPEFAATLQQISIEMGRQQRPDLAKVVEQFLSPELYTKVPFGGSKLVEKAIEQAEEAARKGGQHLGNLIFQAMNDIDVMESGARNEFLQRINDINNQADAQIARGWDNRRQTELRAWRSLNEQLARIDQDRDLAIGKAQYEVQRQAVQILHDQAREWQNYKDKISDINTSLARRLQELDYDRTQRFVQLSNARAEHESKSINKRLDIERDALNQLNELNFRTAEQLRQAQTEHDKEDIMFRYVFEKSQIDQRKNDRLLQLSDEDARFQRQQEQRRKDIEETYRHDKELAGQRATDQQTRADREHAQRLQEIDYMSQKQSEAIQESLRNQFDALEKQETRAYQSYDNQISDAKSAYDEIVKYANKKREEETAKATLEWEKQRDAFIDLNQKLFDVLSNQKIDIKVNLIPQFLQEDIRDYANQLKDWLNSIFPGIVPDQPRLFASGGIVPGTAGSPQLIMAHGGEQVLRPDQQRGMKESTPQFVNISVEPALAPIVNDMLRKMVGSNIFKEGVRIALNDAVFVQ